MSMAFERFCLMVSFANPTAVELSTCMGVAEFAEQCADGDGLMSIDIGGADFGFSGRSHDVGHNFGHGVNG